MYTNGITTISGKKIVVDGCVILNPTKEQLQEAGWREVVPPTPTEEEIARQEREQEIWSLKEQLRASDYKAIKHSEGLISDEDYQPIKEERESIRAEINKVEAMIEEEYYDAYPEKPTEDITV